MGFLKRSCLLWPLVSCCIAACGSGKRSPDTSESDVLDTSVVLADMAGLCEPCKKTADCGPPLVCIGNLCVPKNQPAACADLLDIPEEVDYPDLQPHDVQGVQEDAQEVAGLDETEEADSCASCEDDVSPPGDEGICPECPAGWACVQGGCRCVPSCSGKECGDDGCGGSCGQCGEGKPFCKEGACVECLTDEDCDDQKPCTKDHCLPAGDCGHVAEPKTEQCGNDLDDDCDGSSDEMEDCLLLVAPEESGHSQEEPSVALDGNTVVVCWEEGTGKPYEARIICRRLSLAGADLGGAVKVSDDTVPYTDGPCIASVPGGFVVAWQQCPVTQYPEKCDVFTRSFNSEGQPAGGPIQIDEGLEGAWAVSCSRTPGGVLVTWSGVVSTGAIGEASKVYTLLLGFNGKPASAQKSLGDGESPSIAWMGNGKGVVAFTKRCVTDDTDECVYFRFVSDDGTGIGQAVKASGTPIESDNYPVVATVGNAFLVSWMQDAFYGTDQVARVFDVMGNAGNQVTLGLAKNASSNRAAALGLSDGRFLVAWWHHEDGLRARLTDSSLTNLENEITLTTAGSAWTPAAVQIDPHTALVLFEDGNQLKGRFVMIK